MGKHPRGWNVALPVEIAGVGFLATVLACGGGGGGPAPPSAPPSTPTVTQVAIDAPTTRFLPVQRASFSARALDASGNPVAAGSASWSSSNEDVARVTADGTVVAGRFGGATITATIDGVEGSVGVVVLDDIDLLQAPFEGNFAIVNYMDHDSPREFVDDNGFLLTFWGEEHSVGDGHAGYDWLIPVGVPILAAADGTVVGVFDVGSTPTFFCPPLGRDVNDQREIQIMHTTETGERILTIYVHLSRIDVAAGDQVLAGDQIGLNGNSGCSTAPHLHFAAFRFIDDPAGGLQPAQSRRVIFDPFGWTGAGTDPWEADAEGIPSVDLWKPGQAPAIHRWFDYPREMNNLSPIVITRVRFMGIDDESNPNNEFVQVERDPRFATPTVDLSGFTLHDLEGNTFVFPDGTTLGDDPIRVFSGSGNDSATRLFWGRSSPVWDNTGDCADLRRPDGTFRYRVNTGACP